MNLTKKKGILHSVINFVKRVNFVKKIKKEHKIDYAISYLANADFANILSAQNEKVIVSIRSSFGHDYINPIKRHIVKWIYNKADIIITQNRRIATKFKDYLKITHPEYVVLPNYYDLEKIKDKSLEHISIFENTNNYFILGQIARLYHPKGQWHLLKIFNEVKKRNDNARLVIVGEGDMEDFLITFARNLGLRTMRMSQFPNDKIDLSHFDVCFLGFQSNPFKYLTMFDIFMFTSLYEGFPNALAEAMICGKCVMSTDCETGPMELLAPNISYVSSYPYLTQYGYLMPRFPGQIESYNSPITKEEQLWIDTILTVDTKQQMELGANAKERMKEFSKERIINKWQDTLR
jgi:glycosyltransferase involved in cell wall biosynthesis